MAKKTEPHSEGAWAVRIENAGVVTFDSPPNAGMTPKLYALKKVAVQRSNRLVSHGYNAKPVRVRITEIEP